MRLCTSVLFWIAFLQIANIVSFADPTSGISDRIEISGRVIDPELKGIPAAIISAVSPGARQKSVYSDDEGRFIFRVPTGESAKWYVEIYWNKDLMFRNELRQLRIKGEAGNYGPIWNEIFRTGGRIDLEPIVLGIRQNG